jgi:excisionase family DNA binding protein
MSTFIDARTFERDYHLSRRTFFKWIEQGRLTAFKPSRRRTFVKRADVERLIEESRVERDLEKIINEIVREVQEGK